MSVRKSSIRIAPEKSARSTSSPKARSARSTPALVRRDAPQGRAVPGVHALKLGGEVRQRDVPELADEAAHELAGEALAVLRLRERGAVHVRLPVTVPLQQALGVKARHDRHDRRVREGARLAEVVDDLAHGRLAALPEAIHDRGLERPEELLIGPEAPEATDAWLGHPLRHATDQAWGPPPPTPHRSPIAHRVP